MTTFYIILTLLLFSSAFCVKNEKPLNILALFPHEGRSHWFVFEPYLLELANRGHKLTVVSHFPRPSPVQNYHDISLAGTTKILENNFDVETSFWTPIALIPFLFERGTFNCKNMLKNKKVQDLWKTKEKYDVILYEMFNSDCALGLAHQFNAPTIAVTSCALLPMQYERFGIPYNPSYVPLVMLEGGFHPNIFQRIYRQVFHSAFNFLYKYQQQRADQKILAEYFKDVPPLEELARETKFVLLNHYFPLTGSRLFPVNVIEVGGVHIAKPKLLGKELLKFIEESKHGVIYISLGTMLKASSLKPEKVDAIIKTLEKLPQRVVWKWGGTLPGNPKNIYTSDWLPQNDILAHPNVIAFYSHAGMLSCSESIQQGVPMIVMPIFGDQPSNAAAVEDSGLGVQLFLSDLNEQNLLDAFKKILDPKFRAHVKRLSKLWNDRPHSAMDTAIYWTEFAARNGNFTFRTRAADVPLYQYLCLDIVLVLGFIGFISLYTVKKVLSKMFCVKKAKKAKKNKKE